VRTRRSKELPDAQADLTATPDLFQPLALTHAGLGTAVTLTGLHNLHLKESDRLAAVEAVLQVLDRQAHRTGPDGFRIERSVKLRRPGDHVFDPQGDHRMAMALAPLALVAGPLRIEDPEVVRKSYPGFWDDLRAAGFRVEG
jgi:3-phosphoshikimate 1-carboxyvinyltransferase